MGGGGRGRAEKRGQVCGGGEGGGELKRERTADRCVCWGEEDGGYNCFSLPYALYWLAWLYMYMYTCQFVCL